MKQAAAPSAPRARFRGFLRGLLVASLGLAFLPAGQSRAAAVLSFSLAEIAQQAELIVEAEVVGVTSRLVPGGAMPMTCGRFRVHDVVKGGVAGGELELCFAGGVAGGRALAVPGMRYPYVGARGIYFVESTERLLANPILGWAQGEFPLREVADPIGAETALRVYTADGAPVAAVERGGPSPGQLSNGRARGVVVREGGAPSDAIDVVEFKRQVRALLPDASAGSTR